MLFDRLIGNVKDDPDWDRFNEVETAETVDLEWHECALAALRKSTRAGAVVGIMAPRGRSLRDGDVLVDDRGARLVVRVTPAAVWVARFADVASLVVAALELGNLHVPVEVDGSSLVVAPDGPTREVLDRLHAAVRTETRVFAPLRATVLQGVKLAEGFKVVGGPSGPSPGTPGEAG